MHKVHRQNLLIKIRETWTISEESTERLCIKTRTPVAK